MNSLPVDMDEVLHAVIPVGQWKEPSNQSQVNSVILPFSPERLGQQYPTSSLSSISLKIQHPRKTRLNQQDQGCSGWGETESNPVSDIGLILNGEICCTVERYWILEDSRKRHGCSKRIQQISRHCSSHKSSGDSRLCSRNCGIQDLVFLSLWLVLSQVMASSTSPYCAPDGIINDDMNPRAL